ncbi:MAG: alanine racemase [Deltaproteobacteria bacterium]|nr:alanine racemase [Deltaproteobacteria bacterium]
MSAAEGERQRYERYKRAIAGEPMPCALVDLDAVDENVRRMLAVVEGLKATVRVASKSIRCAPLLKYILGRSERMKGLMCYSAREAAWLSELGFDDQLVAYPSVQRADLAAVCAHPDRISIAVDCEVHVRALADAAARAGVVAKAVIDFDPSLRLSGGRVHLGVRRSPLHTVDEIMRVVDRIAAEKSLVLHGVMAYEAHVAGLPDKNPFAPLMNAPYRAFKALARRQMKQLRSDVFEALSRRGLGGLLYNGAGTASADVARTEPWLTEVTIGSGFVASHLFDYYENLSLVPAAYYALQVTRVPAPGFVTAAGGGYVASGGAGREKLPLPALPPGLSLLPDEGAGEVQTPLRVPRDVSLTPGDPVFFRHSKAGELAEHFSEYLFVRGEHVLERVRTYRGDGYVF